MIGRLTGVLLEKNPPSLLIDVQGVGYEVDVPMSTFYALPALADTVALFTHLIVREDAQLLYGFGTRTERVHFRALLKVNGVEVVAPVLLAESPYFADLASKLLSTTRQLQSN